MYKVYIISKLIFVNLINSLFSVLTKVNYEKNQRIKCCNQMFHVFFSAISNTDMIITPNCGHALRMTHMQLEGILVLEVWWWRGKENHGSLV